MIRDDKSEIDELYTSVLAKDAEEVYNNGHLDANRLCPELKPNVDNAALGPKGMCGKLNDQLFPDGGHEFTIKKASIKLTAQAISRGA